MPFSEGQHPRHVTVQVELWPDQDDPTARWPTTAMVKPSGIAAFHQVPNVTVGELLQWKRCSVHRLRAAT